jgi:hypothetical protein
VPRSKKVLAAERKHVLRVVEQLEAVHWQLVGIKLSLKSREAETQPEDDLGDEMDAATELRVTIECVLEDDIRPALQDLRDVLASMRAKKEDP